MLSAGLLIAATATFQAPPDLPTYRVVEVRQERAFAGKLGERIREMLVLEAGSQRYTVRVEGHIHTLTTRSTVLVKRGDRIVIVGRSRPEQGAIRREDIRRVN